MNNGKLISFEGIDGCGKGTQIRLIEEHYTNQEVNVHKFREPGSTPVAERIRELLLDPEEEMDSTTELMLFSAARRDLITKKLVPLLKEKSLVILDRFYDSTSAYQGFAGGISTRSIETINNLVVGEHAPDATFYLRVDAQTAAQRLEGQRKDRIESKGDSYFSKVIDGYDALANQYPQRIHVIDGAQPIKKISKDLIQRIDALYK